MASEEEILLPPPPKKGSADMGGDDLLPLPPKKKSTGDIGGIDYSAPGAPSEPYTWEGFEAIKTPTTSALPVAGTYATAKPEQAATGIATKPTPQHKPELKMIAVDPQKKLPEEKAKENPAFEAITNAFIEMPDVFSDVGSYGRAGKDKRIEFYKMAYERSRDASKEFNVQEFETLRDQAESKWNDANELYQYNKLLEKNPDNLEYRYAVGFRQMGLGRTQDAVNNFKEIIAKNPKYSPAYSAMAYLYSDKGQNDVAVTFMDDAIEQNPNDAALYSNRSIIKQRAGDIEGAVKDLDFAKSKTSNKNLQLEIEKQYSDIFQRLHQNRDSKTEKYIAMIKGEYNPLDEQADKEFFRDRYNEHSANVVRLTKDIAAQTEKDELERIEKGDFSGMPPDLTVAEEMKGYVRGKGTREALEALIVDPKQAGVAGFIMNPVGFIARAGAEGVGHGVSEVGTGVTEGKPLKVIKGAMEAGIAGIMAVTPVGWMFTGATAGAEALPYGDVVTRLAFAPISTLLGEESDAAAIGDLIVGGVLLHGANKGLKGAKEVLEKSKNKEPFTPEDVKVYEEAIKTMPEPELQKVMEDAGVNPVKFEEGYEAKQNAFVEKQMELLETEGELSPDITKEQYADYFRNLYERKTVEQSTKIKPDEGTKGPVEESGIEGERPAAGPTGEVIGEAPIEGDRPTGQGVLPEGAGRGAKPATAPTGGVKPTEKPFKPKAPKTRSETSRLLDREAESLEEAVLQYFVGGGRIKSEDFTRMTGFGSKDPSTGKTKGLTEFRSKIWAIKKAGRGLDVMGEVLPEGFVKGATAMEIEQKVIDILGSHKSKTTMMERLRELQKAEEITDETRLRYEEDQAAIDQVPEKAIEGVAEISSEELMDLSWSDIEKAELDKLIEQHRDEKGNVNWENLNETLDKDAVDDFPSIPERVKEKILSLQYEGEQKGRRPEDTPAPAGEQVKAEEKAPAKPTAGEVKAQKEYDDALLDIEEQIVAAKKSKQNKLDKLSKKAELFGEEAKADELFGAEQDLSKENIDAQMKPFNDIISNLQKEKEALESSKEKFLKKYEGQAEIDTSAIPGIGSTVRVKFKNKDVDAIIRGVDGERISLFHEPSNSLFTRHIDDVYPKTEMGGELPASTTKAYEDIAGLKPKSVEGRVPVEPILGAPVKDISQIIFDVTKGTKQRLFYAKPGSGRRSAIGTYSPGSSAVKIKFNGDLDTTAHELGHSIDDYFGLLSDLQKTPNLPVEIELNKFAPFGSTPPKGHPNPRMYKYGEGFAEFLRAYIVNPEKAKAEAPNLFELYDSKVHPEYKKAVDNFSQDIRAWAGASGRDMVLSNVEWKPEQKKGIVGQILSKSEPNNMFGITWADRLAANFINPLRAFEKANEYAKGLKGIDEVLPQNDPVLLARTLLGVDGKVSELLETGMIDSKLNVLKDKDGNVKNLKWLLEPLDNSDMASIERGAKDVISYMIAERTVELSKKFDRESVLSGIGGGIFKDVDVAKKTLEEFEQMDPQKKEAIKEATSRYREMADDVLKYMVDKGRLSKENYDKIKADNTQYVAMQRVIEAEPGREIEVYSSGGGAKLGSKTEVVQSIKGSTKKIQNPYTSLLDLIYKGVKEADRNESLLAFRDMLVPERKGMYDGTPIRLADIGERAKSADKETVTIFVDGKPEYWKFQNDVYKALKGLDSEAYKLPAVVTALPSLLRWTVTNFPVFAMRNVVRDFQDRIIKSNENSYKNLYGIKDIAGDKEHWKEVARSGGLNSGFYMKDKVHYYGLLNEAMRDMAKSKNSILVDPSRLNAGWEGYKSLLQKSETVNRVAEYRAAFRNAKERGMDDYNAKLYGAMKSRDLLDFALMGHWMKVVNQLIPFSNAAIQGTRSALTRAAENPMGFMARMTAFSVAPSMAEWLINNKDEESKKQYNELPDYQKDMFYNFKIGPNSWVSIPKPYELSLMGAGVARGMSYFAGKKDAFDGYAGSVAKSTFPFDEASFAGGFQSIVEATTNYDYFRDKNIVAPHEDALDLSLRDTGRASRLGKALQEVSGIDARKIDHFIKGSFSYFGKTATEISDIGREDKESFTLGDLGFFKQSPAYNSKSVQEFLELSKKGNFTSTAPYKEFGVLAKRYFNAKTDEEKENLSKVLTEYAASNLDLMRRSLKEKIKQKTKE